MSTIDVHTPASDQARLLAQAGLFELYQAAMRRLGAILDLDRYLGELAAVVAEMTHYRRTLALALDANEVSLRFGAIAPAGLAPEIMTRLKAFQISMYSDDAVVQAWIQGKAAHLNRRQLHAKSPLLELATLLEAEAFYTLPLRLDAELVGVLIMEAVAESAAADMADADRLHALAPLLGMGLGNARVHSRAMQELAAKMRELTIMRQIDRELTDTIQLEHVYNLTLDWALRYTNAHAASLAVYDQTTGHLRYREAIGYDLTSEQLAAVRAREGASIALRVARSGQAELVPDVNQDKDYQRLAPDMRSMLCAPVKREDRVIAVISLESRRAGAFTEDHLEFVDKLGARAGVAIDNARLFDETVREREKLAGILSNTADVVMVVNPMGKIDLINQSAVAVMALEREPTLVGRPFADVFADTALLSLFEAAQTSRQATIGEIVVPDGRTFHANLAPFTGLGWIIVMHDITPFKETDRLKNELVATVSHDLKQPLSVMFGYTELLQMQMNQEPLAAGYVENIQRSIGSMRHLIDDLLDMAKIESGIKLKPQPVPAHLVIADCVTALRQAAEAKSMRVEVDLPETLPPILGEPSYLNQIFMNLVGNAVKYTPAGGHIRISAEAIDGSLRIAVQDNGLGISPEDQARIFDRFYRVRRRETDGIDGTGLGLAIVKRLIELHGGQIGLVSVLGEGSTFYVTLPSSEAAVSG